MLFESLLFNVIFCVVGVVCLVIYAIGKKKRTPEIKASESGRLKKVMLSDVLINSIGAFMAGSGAAGIVTHFIVSDNFPETLFIAWGLLAFGAAGLVVYIVDRKFLAGFEDKRFYDVLAFVVLGGLALTGIVLTVLYFIR
jgi:hypothetical protein